MIERYVRISLKSNGDVHIRLEQDLFVKLAGKQALYAYLLEDWWIQLKHAGYVHSRPSSECRSLLLTGRTLSNAARRSSAPSSCSPSIASLDPSFCRATPRIKRWAMSLSIRVPSFTRPLAYDTQLYDTHATHSSVGTDCEHLVDWPERHDWT